MSNLPVTCPSCCETFEIVAPPPQETPCDLDYDCEVCCRPMRIVCEPGEDGEVAAWARGLDE